MCNKDNVIVDEDLYNTLEEFESHVDNYDTDVSIYGGGRMDAFAQPIKDERWDWLWAINNNIELNNPYIIAKEICNKLENLIKPLESKISNVVLYRARIGIDTMLLKPGFSEEDTYKVAIPFRKSKIGAPKPSLSNDGRFNRKGTSYLYLASTMETAINEIRPSVGHDVSIGQFRISKEVKIIDFTKLDFYDYAYSDNKIEEYVKLENIEQMMCVPNPDKQYTITQCFADALLLLGFDGIKFYSSVSDSSYNMVLFEKRNAVYVDGTGQAIHINKLKYDYQNQNTKLDEKYLDEYVDINNPDKTSKTIFENYGIDIRNGSNW
jgi:RES domain-containing protein